MTQSALQEVAFWEVDLHNDQRSTSVQPCIFTTGIVDIGIFQEPQDNRVPVEEKDVRRGGKYHSILKLFFWFEDLATWTTATGWLLKEDLVVTAGHCVYNDNQRATCIKAYMGYSPNSEKASPLKNEGKYVKRVVLPVEWVNEEIERHDVAFLQLDRPFGNATPFMYDSPDIHARQQFTIVGYPVDLDTGENHWGKMYEMKIDRVIDLQRTKWNMLTYQGDRRGGLSGSPLIRDGDSAIIGVHVRGGSFNSALVIGGPYGVNFEVYEEATRMLHSGDIATLEVRSDTDKNWLKYLPIPRNSGC